MPRGSRYTNPAADTLFTQWIDATSATKTGVNLKASQTQVDVGTSITLSLDDVYSNGFFVPTTSSVTWASSNTNVLSVSGSTASINAVPMAGGTATVTATAGGFSKSITITANQANPATALQLVGAANLKLVKGETQQLAAVATIANVLTGVNNQAVWSSSNAAVASVSATGLVTGGATAGSTTITVTYSGLSANYTVTSLGEGQYIYFKKPAAWATPSIYAYSTTNAVDTPATGTRW
jgi:uncharacterized protein YjdB